MPCINNYIENICQVFNKLLSLTHIFLIEESRTQVFFVVVVALRMNIIQNSNE